MVYRPICIEYWIAAAAAVVIVYRRFLQQRKKEHECYLCTGLQITLKGNGCLRWLPLPSELDRDSEGSIGKSSV